MKYILAISNEINGIALELFNTKEELLKYLNKNEWYLLNSVDWDSLEKYTATEAEYIAQKPEFFGPTSEAHLRIVKG